MTTRKEFIVSAIENGTVIDHIPSKNVFQVIKILNLEESDDMVLFGTNLESKKYGKKGIIKVKNKFFKNSEINKIALVAPKATLIVIKDYQITSKQVVELPDDVQGIVKCFNPNCITNHEKVETKFNLIDKEEVKLRCHYCEKITDKKNMIVI
ncbi:MAG TPA: aspartate carbamoyltransferase regulatory subunit [Bacteroidales bacterium]|nr:aspartate carbamoyltransferase regulatory subunit [Bacteroidales bacterium]HQI45050.1 aspartate carbamoyltransferase regulatory subunit [Bacteroidales bacterium]